MSPWRPDAWLSSELVSNSDLKVPENGLKMGRVLCPPTLPDRFWCWGNIPQSPCQRDMPSGLPYCVICREQAGGAGAKLLPGSGVSPERTSRAGGWDKHTDRYEMSVHPPFSHPAIPPPRQEVICAQALSMANYRGTKYLVDDHKGQSTPGSGGLGPQADPRQPIFIP